MVRLWRQEQAGFSSHSLGPAPGGGICERYQVAGLSIFTKMHWTKRLGNSPPVGPKTGPDSMDFGVNMQQWGGSENAV